jgi:nicotinamidase-related amidase
MMDSQADYESGNLLPTVEAAADPLRTERPGRVHWVVVTTHRIATPEGVPTIHTRFWHPRDHRWSENVFDSLDHALRLFVDESGWVLRQQQALDTPDAHELIFEARREDFSRPSTAEMLEDVGLTREDVAKLLDRVDREGGTP